MQPFSTKNTDIQFLKSSKYFVPDSLLLDSHVTGLEVVTENTTYTFIKTGKTPEGNSIWYVIDGKQELVGKEVGLLSLTQKGLLEKNLKLGDKLAIFIDLGVKLGTKIWNTSKVLSFSIIKYS